MGERSRIPIVTLVLVALNVLVFIYVEWRGSSYDGEFMLQMGAISESLVMREHQYYRLISHFFLHFGLEHLANNMISLLVLGYALEPVMGRVRYGITYFLCGILAGMVSIAYNVSMGNPETISCGASGAIYGLSGALLVMLVMGNRNRGRRSTEVPRYLIYMAVSLYCGIQDSTIDNAAHVGGFVAGVLLCLIMSKRKRMEVTYES